MGNLFRIDSVDRSRWYFHGTEADLLAAVDLGTFIEVTVAWDSEYKWNLATPHIVTYREVDE